MDVEDSTTPTSALTYIGAEDDTAHSRVCNIKYQADLGRRYLSSHVTDRHIEIIFGDVH